MINLDKPLSYLNYKGKVENILLLNKVIKKYGTYQKAINKLNEFFIKLASEKISLSFSEDLLIGQEIELINELDKVINLLFERLREIYGFYFPEAIRNQNLEKLTKILSNDPSKEHVSKKLNIKPSMIPKKKFDLNLIKLIAIEIQNLIKLKKETESNVKKIMKNIAPNLSKTTGEILGAKLISLAGGLKNLAKMPSSTIQVLGAEKALFRHIVKGSKPPKHGIILQHPTVSSANLKNRGKVARQLASKISTAARIDYFRGREK